MLKKASKRPHVSKALRKYYRAYYNEHMLRNYRFLYDRPQHFTNEDGELIEYEATSLKASKYDELDDSLTRAPEWIFKKTRAKYGTLAGEITYYKELAEFKNGDIALRFCDRLFFDFDHFKTPELEALKEEFKKCNNDLDGKAYRNKYVELQKSFRKLIFEGDLLRDVYEHATRLTEYLTRVGLKPYLIFSGSKGFHVNVFFNEMQITHLSDIQKTLARTYIKDLNLNEKYFDFKVFDRTRAQKRLQRIQYGAHSKTGLITRPVPLDTPYDELLDLIKNKKRHPVAFNFEDFIAPEGFNRMLTRLDTEIGLKKMERQNRLERENKLKRQELAKRYGDNVKLFNDIDLRDIARAYGIDGKHDGEKITCLCPFHHDTHPSAVIYPSRFYCSTCGFSLNYYAFISKLEGTNDKDKILDTARRFL